MNTVISLALKAPAIDRREILCYAGMTHPTDAVNALLEECISETEAQLVYKICYTEFDISADGNLLHLGFADVVSGVLANHLTGCRRIFVFAATIGLAFDRCIARYSRISPAKALLLQAYGAERIEALCDRFCEQMASKLPSGARMRPRFSPGYGDLPLALQTDIFRALDCPRKIGLTLNNSLLMSPSKSVTAIIGIADEGETV